VQVDQSTTEWFPNQKDVRQGCILSPGLFDLYTKYIIKTGGLGDMVTGIGKVRLEIKTSTHTDDTTVLVERTDDMMELIKLVKNSGEVLGLILNLQKTMVMGTVGKANISKMVKIAAQCLTTSFWWLSAPMAATPMKRPKKV
jgi:hypothetical protein